MSVYAGADVSEMLGADYRTMSSTPASAMRLNGPFNRATGLQVSSTPTPNVNKPQAFQP